MPAPGSAILEELLLAFRRFPAFATINIALYGAPIFLSVYRLRHQPVTRECSEMASSSFWEIYRNVVSERAYSGKRFFTRSIEQAATA
jgi:hypothetical protein